MRTEVYSTGVGEWKTLDDYPFNEELQLGAHAVLYNDGAFYLFGGESARYRLVVSKVPTLTNIISRLDTKTYIWSRAGCPP